MSKIAKVIRQNQGLIFIIVFGFTIRIVLTDFYYSLDAASFPLWGRYLTNHNFADLYINVPGSYPPYLPGYYLFLKPWATLANILKIPANTWTDAFFFKLPVYLADTLIAVLIYKISENINNVKKPLMETAFFYLNPAVIFVTSIWGQIDSIVMLFALAFVYLTQRKKIRLAVISLSIGVLVKFQALAIAPLFILIVKNSNLKKVLILFLISVTCAFLVFAPIIFEENIVWVVKYVYHLPNQYPYTSVYSYNIWALVGFMIPDSTKVLGLVSFKYLSLIFLAIAVVVLVLPLILKEKKSSKSLYFCSFLLFFSFALLATRIHSRYFIYLLPFLAVFVRNFKILGLLFTFFLLANLLMSLPVDFTRTLMELLRSRSAVFLFTFLGIGMYFYSLKIYFKESY